MRVAVVGTGVAGRSHLLDIVTDERCELAAVCAAHETNACEAFDLFGAESWFVSAERMLASAALEAVVIATPPAVTPRLLACCMAAGVPVLVDKPAGVSADALAALAAPGVGCSPAVTVAYNRRYETHVRYARALVLAHPGAFVAAECRWSAPFRARYASTQTYRSACGFGEGVILDTASHIFDTLAFLGVGPLAVRSCALYGAPGRPGGADVAADLVLAGDLAHVAVSIGDGDAEDDWELMLRASWGTLRLTRDALTGSADGQAVGVAGHDIHRPVVDLYCPATERCGATLGEAVAALHLVDQARVKARSRIRWIRPRAKALGRLNGAC